MGEHGSGGGGDGKAFARNMRESSFVTVRYCGLYDQIRSDQTQIRSSSIINNPLLETQLHRIDGNGR